MFYTDWIQDPDYTDSGPQAVGFALMSNRVYQATASDPGTPMAPPGKTTIMDPLIMEVAAESGGSWVNGSNPLGYYGAINQTGGALGGPTLYTAQKGHTAFSFSANITWAPPPVPDGWDGVEVDATFYAATPVGLVWESVYWQEDEVRCTAPAWSTVFMASTPTRFNTSRTPTPLWDPLVEGKGEPVLSIDKGDFPNPSYAPIDLPGGGVDLSGFVAPTPTSPVPNRGYVTINYETQTPASASGYPLTESNFSFGGAVSLAEVDATYTLRPPRYRFYREGSPQPYRAPLRLYPRSDTRRWPRPATIYDSPRRVGGYK